MKTIAIYPGTFNPFHEGHKDIVEQALKVFDRVIVARGINTQKDLTIEEPWFDVKLPKGAEYLEFHGLLVGLIETLGAHAVIRGLRNAKDLEYEESNQFANVKLGLSIPIFYIISKPEHKYLSSSLIREMKKIQGAIERLKGRK